MPSPDTDSCLDHSGVEIVQVSRALTTLVPPPFSPATPIHSKTYFLPSSFVGHLISLIIFCSA